MKCSKCGSVVENGSMFCTVCGTRIGAIQADVNNVNNNPNNFNMNNNMPNNQPMMNNNMPNNQPMMNNGMPNNQPMMNNNIPNNQPIMNNMEYQNNPAPKSNKTPLIILILLLLVGIGVGVYFLTRPTESSVSGGGNPTPTPSNTVPTPTEIIETPEPTVDISTPEPTIAPSTDISTPVPTIENVTPTPSIIDNGNKVTCTGSYEEEGVTMKADVIGEFDASNALKNATVVYDINDAANASTYCSLFKLMENAEKDVTVSCSGTKITITNYDKIDDDGEFVTGITREKFIEGMESEEFTCR